MQSFVTPTDTSVSDRTPETRLYSLRINPLRNSECQLDYAAAEIYSQIAFQIRNLSDWVRVQAPITAIAQLQTAGLVDVRVEGE